MNFTILSANRSMTSLTRSWRKQAVARRQHACSHHVDKPNVTASNDAAHSR